MNSAKRRSLDIYRLIAMLLVMWGHLIGVAMYAYEIYGVINGTMEQPIIAAQGNRLAFLEDFLYYRLNTQAAVLGVVMFFICTGYLVPGMLRRYRRSEFLVNRALRVFPTLWVSIAIMGVVVFVSQGVRFTAGQFISSGFLVSQFFGLPSVMGLLWTLTVEVAFYLFAGIIGKTGKEFVAFGYGVAVIIGIAFFGFFNGKIPDLFIYFRYMCFSFLGSAFYYAEADAEHSENKIGAYWIVVAAFAANLAIFQINKALFGDDTTYPNFFTQFVPLVLFAVIVGLERHWPKLFEKIPGWVYKVAELVYPVYLTHICCGLTAMYWASKWGLNRYLVVLLGFVVSFAVAKLIALTIERYSVRLSRRVIAGMRKKFSKITSDVN